jgi:hypothetical protein
MQCVHVVYSPSHAHYDSLLVKGSFKLDNFDDYAKILAAAKDRISALASVTASIQTVPSSAGDLALEDYRRLVRLPSAGHSSGGAIDLTDSQGLPAVDGKLPLGPRVEALGQTVESLRLAVQEQTSLLQQLIQRQDQSSPAAAPLLRPGAVPSPRPASPASPPAAAPATPPAAAPAPSPAAAPPPLPATQPLNVDDDYDLDSDNKLGGASANKANDAIDIRGAVAAAKALAADAGELFRYALQLPERDSNGKAFYEYSPSISGEDPGWKFAEPLVNKTLSDIAQLSTAGGHRTKAAKAIMLRVAGFVTGHIGESGSGTAASVAQQRKALRGYAAMLRHVAPGYVLKKADIVHLFPSDQAANDALSTESLVVDLLAESQ